MSHGHRGPHFVFEPTLGWPLRARDGRIATFDCIAHGQLVVSWLEIATYFIWTDAHVAQGFTWSPVRVAFVVPDHDGLCRVEIERSSDVDFEATNALWAVQVPFEVLPNELLKIGSVDDEREIAIQAGRYSLVFAAYPGAALGAGYAFRLRLLFRSEADAEFAILKAGDALTTDVVLREDADPI